MASIKRRQQEEIERQAILQRELEQERKIKRLIELQSETQRQLARDLHDEIGGVLTGHIMMLEIVLLAAQANMQERAAAQERFMTAQGIALINQRHRHG